MNHLGKLLLILLTSLTTSSHAFWPSDADILFNDYNNAFYVGNNGNAYYKNDTTGGGFGFWTGAEEIEMVLDSYARTGSPGTRDMVTALCNGFLATHGHDWTWNIFNDDIAWAVIAFSRAYQITGNTLFRDRAKANFDAMFARAWDNALGGGLWWTTARNEKNACVNGPGAICAFLLYQIYNDSSYLTKAQAIYNWERNTLFNAGTGQVYDNINSSGVINTWVFTYNQGTFIGAANYLGHVADAVLAADCTKNTLCVGGILPDSTENSDGGGFNGIFLRWMAKFMVDRNLQGTYLRWLQLNANAAWNVRRADNLSWCNWRTPTPTGIRYSWGCVNAPLALQVIPSDGEGVMFLQDIDYAGVPSELIGTGSWSSSQLSARGALNDWATSLRVPPGWKVTMYSGDNLTGSSWTFTADTAWIGAANDQMSSCKIETTGVIFYRDAGYQGARSQTLGVGNYTLTQLIALGVPNDWASALRVPSGYQVIVYADDNFAGTTWTFSGEDPDLADNGCDNILSSVRIVSTTVPPVPTGLTAVPGNGQVSLTWSSSAGATSYNVKRATVSGGPYSTVGTPTEASFVNNGLNNGTTYYYVVSAVSSGGESGNSSQVSATPTVPVESILQQNTSGTTKMDVKRGQRGSQSFRHGTAGGPSYTITKLVLYLSREQQGPNGNLVVSIGTGINSAPLSGSTVTVTPSSVSNTSAGSSFQTYTITFASPVGPLTAGGTYYINLDAEAASNGKAYYLQYNGSSTYANGTYYKSGSDDGKDIRFQVWGR